MTRAYVPLRENQILPIYSTIRNLCIDSGLSEHADRMFSFAVLSYIQDEYPGILEDRKDLNPGDLVKLNMLGYENFVSEMGRMIKEPEYRSECGNLFKQLIEPDLNRITGNIQKPMGDREDHSPAKFITHLRAQFKKKKVKWN